MINKIFISFIVLLFFGSLFFIFAADVARADIYVGGLSVFGGCLNGNEQRDEMYALGSIIGNGGLYGGWSGWWNYRDSDADFYTNSSGHFAAVDNPNIGGFVGILHHCDSACIKLSWGSYCFGRWWVPVSVWKYCVCENTSSYCIGQSYQDTCGNWNCWGTKICDYNSAQYISQDVPTSVNAGQSFSVSVTMKNNGTKTWTDGALYRLGSQNPSDNSTWGLGRVGLSGVTVSPNGQKTFTFNATAPSVAGSYNFQWRMVQDGVEWFGDYTPNVVINVIAQPSSASDLNVASPDYCSSGPGATLSWVFSGGGGTQASYQIQIKNSGGADVYNSSKVDSASTSFSVPAGVLSYDTSYTWKLKVWGISGPVSGWIDGPAFTTKKHQYPTASFNWAPQSPVQNESVAFYDRSSVYGGAAKSAWSWTFQDGSPATSGDQNPVIKFLTTGLKTVILRITDSDGFTCQTSQQVNVGGSLPNWKEVAP